MKRVCVFCGSSAGVKPVYAQVARQVGQALAARGLGLVYGGGRVGLMGAVADGALEAGGEVIGVIPRALMRKELAHEGATTLHVVEGMHERKALMHHLSDAFLTLPGGAGTLEELFEVWTWAQLGYHHKPCAILDVESFYSPLLAHVDQLVEQGFLRAAYRDHLLVDTALEPLLERMAAYQPPRTKWADLDESP